MKHLDQCFCINAARASFYVWGPGYMPIRVFTQHEAAADESPDIIEEEWCIREL